MLIDDDKYPNKHFPGINPIVLGAPWVDSHLEQQ